MQPIEKLIHLIESKCVPLALDKPASHNALLEQIGDANIVLMGEATHGSHEFYQIRADISRQLIKKKGFMAIAIEADWPDAYQVNLYIKGMGDKNAPEKSLARFTRFPTWMWRNRTLVPFIQWLRDYNDKVSQAHSHDKVFQAHSHDKVSQAHPQHKVGFYGLDLYSLQSSMQAVIDYLQEVDPKEAQRALVRYACFDHLSIDPESYGYLTNMGVKEACVNEAVEQFLEMQHHAIEFMHHDGISAEEAHFYATQNARCVKNAELYYRMHFEGRVSSWNIRDRHMAETLHVLAHHLEHTFKRPAKIIVWAHNSHVGDARATEMAEQEEINIGQLIREEYGLNAFNIGFSTYQGSVTAATEWGDAPMKKEINPGMPGSYEALFHDVKYPNFMLPLRGDEALAHYLQLPRLQRAIGVLYRPETERHSHYFFTKLPYQFDTIIHIDTTSAVEPLTDIDTPL